MSVAMNLNSNWLVSTNDFRQIYEKQPVFLLTQCLLLLGGLCTLKHASSNGGRWLLLWLIILLNGTLLELISTSVPNISIFWHSQGPVMLFGGKVPLGILLFYPCVYYTSIFSASLLKLPLLCESLAGESCMCTVIVAHLRPLWRKKGTFETGDKDTFPQSEIEQPHLWYVPAGIIAEIINFPVDYIGLKYLQFTWHDSDPAMLDRSYHSVPWNALYFHLLYGTVQCFLFNINGGAQKLVGDDTKKRRKQPQESTKWRIFLLNIAATIPLLFISFAIFYHTLHDLLGIHTQIVFLSTFSSVVGIVWTASHSQNDRQFKYDSNKIGETTHNCLVIFVFIYYSFFLLVPFLFEPETVITTGPRQPIGPCNVTEPVYTILGQVLERNKHICWRKQSYYNYFDFHCVPDFATTENEIISEYTICGTPFQNKAEFVTILVGDAILAFCILKRVFFSVSNHSQSNKGLKQC